MTEPTAEQIEAQQDRAYEVVCEGYRIFGWGMEEMAFLQRQLATALARVRIEAHAAGRDEGLGDALNVAEEFDNDGRFSAWEAAIQICNAIRALRGRG